MKRSDAVTTGYSNTYDLCGLLCCVSSTVTDAICGVVHHSIPVTYSVCTLCWALIGMQLVHLQIHNSEKENPNIPVVKSGKQPFVWQSVLSMNASCCYCRFLRKSLYLLSHWLSNLPQKRHGCFLWSEDNNVRHMFLTFEQCSFFLNCGQIYAFIWGHETVRIIYCSVWTVEGMFLVSKYRPSVWSSQFLMQLLPLNFNHFSRFQWHYVHTSVEQ